MIIIVFINKFLLKAVVDFMLYVRFIFELCYSLVVLQNNWTYMSKKK